MLRVPPDGIGAGDKFFLSDGDSISAMRLVAWARETGVFDGSSLTVADVFQHPILSDLAATLDARRTDGARLPQAPCYQPFCPYC